MKPSKYNPQIPNKYDGWYPRGWLSPHRLRVTTTIEPVIHRMQSSLHPSSYYFFSYDVLDYDGPMKESVALLDQLLPGQHHFQRTRGSPILIVYCDQWPDEAIIKLSNGRGKTHLRNGTIEHCCAPERCRVSNLVGSLVRNIKYEIPV